jgi:solute carrier family 35 (UDP-sugar transporter), member A1/2/3
MTNTTQKNHLLGVPIKYIALVVLVVQNSALVLLMRYSKLVSGPQYRHTTAVVSGECIKVVTCFVILFKSEDFSIFKLYNLLYREIYSNPKETLAMAVPAILYTIQNNLLFVAVGNLEPATFQVSYQFKILTTALFSMWMLGKRIEKLQWISLSILALGVGLVQIPPSTFIKWIGAKSIMLPTPDVAKVIPGQFMWMGLVAVLLACFLSGFSGVYFEKNLKGSNTSIWCRNIQLGVFSMVFGVFGMLIDDGRALINDGFFYGYTPLVWAMVLVGAIGGLTVAIVVKYADNILKGFATSLSIVLSAFISMWLFDFHGHVIFWVGTVFVILAVFLYSRPITSSKNEAYSKEQSINSSEAI